MMERQATSRFFLLLNHYYFRSGFWILVSFFFGLAGGILVTHTCVHGVRDGHGLGKVPIGDCRVYDIGKRVMEKMK
jgi:hypothetical protein